MNFDSSMILLAAAAPAAVLLWYIYRRDRYQKEPPAQLLKGFAYGVLSVFISQLIARPLSQLFICTGGLASTAYESFFCAAIPEELAKALCLFLFLRKNKYFDEYMDGIVYSVSVGMGFACVENIMYLFDFSSIWIQLGIVRGCISVPAHFAFAVFMGYYFSLWRMGGNAACFWKMLAYPILIHGIFDVVVTYAGLGSLASLIISAGMVWFLHKLRVKCSELIDSHLEKS